MNRVHGSTTPTSSISSSSSSSSATASTHPTFHASPQLQTQMYDIAVTSFPAPRKQNIACDACRSRKVKCHQIPGAEKCQHCLTKNYPCTHYVQAATTKKRAGGISRKNRGSSTPLTDPGPNPISVAPPSPTSSPGPTQSTNSTLQLLAWLFTPTPDVPPPPYVGGATYWAHRSVLAKAAITATASYRAQVNNASSLADWGEVGVKLSDESFRVEFALDLIEVYMQICHTRQPILDPQDFRNRFKASLPVHLQPPDTPRGGFDPLPPGLLAVVLAWGTKFSEHSLLVLDRSLNNGRSRLSRSLVKKAMDVAEGERCYRLPTAESILTCMIIEGIQSHSKSDPDRYSMFWCSSAIRLMMDLQVNRRSVISEPPESGQDTLVFCWWIACLSDAIGSAYLRRKPMVDDDDYDTRDFQLASQFGSQMDPALPAGVQAAYLSWYASLHALARVIRQMCKALWIPATEAEGIPYETLVNLVNLFSQWRDEHLDRVGVPSNFEADWDFVAAVTACSSDATFHVMWIIMSQALDDFGLKEENILRAVEPLAQNHAVAGFDQIRHKLSEEALHGALRIAGLAGVLTQNSYLRLDPNALHYCTYAAGHLLARQGRSEVRSCIEGLRQYGAAYEEAFEQAEELEMMYQATMSSRSPTVHAADTFLTLGQHGRLSGQAHAMALAYAGSPTSRDFIRDHSFTPSSTGSTSLPSLYSSTSHEMYGQAQ